MSDMKERFGVKVGLSDHTMGPEVALAAVALGASMVEKHFILDRSIGGPDAAFSMEKEEFAAMVKGIRNVEKALGSVSYPKDSAAIPGRAFSRSLYIAQDMKAGDMFTPQNVRSVRPGYGMHPKYLPAVLGRTIARDAQAGERLLPEMIQ